MGQRVDLQPFDDGAMQQLLQRFPVRTFNASPAAAVLR